MAIPGCSALASGMTNLELLRYANATYAALTGTGEGARIIQGQVPSNGPFSSIRDARHLDHFIASPQLLEAFPIRKIILYQSEQPQPRWV